MTWDAPAWLALLPLAIRRGLPPIAMARALPFGAGTPGANHLTCPSTGSCLMPCETYPLLEFLPPLR